MEFNERRKAIQPVSQRYKARPPRLQSWVAGSVVSLCLVGGPLLSVRRNCRTAAAEIVTPVVLAVTCSPLTAASNAATSAKYCGSRSVWIRRVALPCCVTLRSRTMSCANAVRSDAGASATHAGNPVTAAAFLSPIGAPATTRARPKWVPCRAGRYSSPCARAVRLM